MRTPLKPISTSINRRSIALITLVWLLVIIGAVVDIGYHFYRAIKKLQVEKEMSRRRRSVRLWEVGVFLVIAALALGVVNGLRWYVCQ